MTLLHALLLGAIQGLTEFLPISSSGHLVLAQYFFGIDKVLLDKAILFDLTLHMGTVFAVLYCYWEDFREIKVSIFNRDKFQAILIPSNIAVLFFVSIIGTGIVVLPLEELFKEAFENPMVAAIGLIATSAILFISLLSRGYLSLLSMNGLKAFVIGIAQGIAAIPGVSRSGLTIVTAMFLGLNAREAARYSFLLSVPTIILASIVQAVDVLNEGSLNVPIGHYIVGFISSLIFGIIAIKALVAFLGRSRIAWFGVYCLPIGLIAYRLVTG